MSHSASNSYHTKMKKQLQRQQEEFEFHLSSLKTLISQQKNKATKRQWMLTVQRCMAQFSIYQAQQKEENIQEQNEQSMQSESSFLGKKIDQISSIAIINQKESSLQSNIFFEQHLLQKPEEIPFTRVDFIQIEGAKNLQQFINLLQKNQSLKTVTKITYGSKIIFQSQSSSKYKLKKDILELIEKQPQKQLSLYKKKILSMTVEGTLKNGRKVYLEKVRFHI